MRRVKIVKECPNPLFEQWLEEWKNEATASNNPIRYTLNNALKALRKYPLTLNSGKECAVLDSFGTKICNMLDNQLTKYKQNPEIFTSNKVSNINLLNDNNIDIRNQNLEIVQRTNDMANDTIQKARKPRNNTQNIYLPKKGTGANSILVTMLQNSEQVNYPGYMLKSDIINQAQEYCDSPMKSNASNHYAGWSSMTKLTQKGYIIKKSNPAKYYLTEKGIALATQLRDLNKSQQELSSSTKNFTSFSSSNYLNHAVDSLPSTSSQTQPSSHFPNSDNLSTSSINNILNYAENDVVLLDDNDVEPMIENNCYKNQDPKIENKIHSKCKNKTTSQKENKNKDFLKFCEENAEPSFDFPKKKKHYIFSENFDCMSENKIENIELDSNINKNTKQSNVNELLKAKKPKITYDKTNKEPNSKSLDYESFYLLPNNFDILLLVDCSETNGGKTKTKNDKTISELNQTNVKYEVRRLNVGDFLWIARCKFTQKELVLPYIVERKRLDDLGASMKDGRYREQKFRLKQCGLKNVIYLIENMKTVQTQLPIANLTQGIINTSVIDNFSIKCTRDLRDSIQYLSILTEIFIKEYESQELKSCKKNDFISTKDNYCTKTLMEFLEFNKTSCKTKNFKVNEMFIKQLIQLKGLSVNMAIAITENFSTPSLLLNAYKKCTTDTEKEKLLTNIEFYNNSKKIKISPAVSKTICNFYTIETFS